MKYEETVRSAIKAMLLVGCLGNAWLAEAASSLPNVIVILVDDMGYGDLSRHGGPIADTPELDRLHDESIRFTDFHVAPACTASRGQLLTGIDCLRNGARWVGTQETNLRTDLPTMAELLRARGYRTGLFGKWHLGDNYPLRPQDRGFEETVWFPQASIGDKMGESWMNTYFDDTYIHNGLTKKYKGYCGDVWFDEAMDWIKRSAAEKKPFFCYLANNLPHSPYFAKKKDREEFLENDRLNIKQKTYFAMVGNIDENIGRLDSFLTEMGLKENTIVIFMSDNGGTEGVPIYNAGMRGWKTTLWEGGHRVPCFIRWPDGQLGPARDISGLTQVQDILPTLMALTGEDPATGRFDGISLAPMLRGAQPVPDRTLVVQYQSKDKILKEDACVMWRRWRLIGGDALYDLETDPHQDRNVIHENMEIAERLRDYHNHWWSGLQPDLDLRGQVIIGHDSENPSVLNASGWKGPYIVDNDAVRRGRRANGVWNLTVAQEGTYRIALRRWPVDVDVAMCEATVPVPYPDAFSHGEQSEPGVALPIATARLKMGGYESEKQVGETDREAVFETSLPAGPITMQTWLLDRDGKLLSGAYYVSIERLPSVQNSAREKL